jgi:prepilin peptidase CpaA
MPSFYPDAAFGWTFYAALVGFLAVATYIDIRLLKIPKQLTLSMLAVGLLVSLVRGAWMGSLLEQAGSDQKVWLFASSPALGALDGLLCALAGCLIGFVSFCILWLLGAMGGGDVKLMAALGAWLGPSGLLIVGTGSLVMFVLIGLCFLVRNAVRRGLGKTLANVAHGAKRDNLRKTPGGLKRRDQLLAFSLPVALATALLLPLLLLTDLHHPRPPRNEPGEQTSARR